jgi:hypothetical protein
VSFDHFTANSQYGSNFHTNLNTALVNVVTGVNTVETAQVAADTLTEADFADEINPRIRTDEGASCNFVYSGLIPATDAGDLTSDISAGVAYPGGYRCSKAAATAHTYTSGKWTFVEMDTVCDFQYQVQATGTSTPALLNADNVRLARVSTDSGKVDEVRDLRTTNCAAAKFNEIKNSATEADLADVLEKGKQFASSDDGWIRGARVSYGTHTTFFVTAGSAYFPQNGEYRQNDQITVQQQADDPVNGTSGIDTGSTAASTQYYVFLAADEDGVDTYSATYSTSAVTPTGVTNYRRVGKIKTGAGGLWVSRDYQTFHTVNQRQLVHGWGSFNGAGTDLSSADTYNVTDITDEGTGNYVIQWEEDFVDVDYGFACWAYYGEDGALACSGSSSSGAPAVGTIELRVKNTANGDADATSLRFIAIGEKQ